MSVLLPSHTIAFFFTHKYFENADLPTFPFSSHIQYIVLSFGSSINDSNTCACQGLRFSITLIGFSMKKFVTYLPSLLQYFTFCSLFPLHFSQCICFIPIHSVGLTFFLNSIYPCKCGVPFLPFLVLRSSYIRYYFSGNLL